MIFDLFNLKTIVLVFTGGFLPAFLWLWFWLKEDHKNPEPKLMIFRTFLAGGLSVFAAFYLQRETSSNFDLSSLDSLTVDFNVLRTAISVSLPYIGLFFGWAIIEELVKYLAAAFAAFRNKNFDEPVDAMVYMITAALGFAAVENSLFLLKSLRLGLGGFEFLINGNLRFLGATLLHIFSSAVVGAAVSFAFTLRGGKKILCLVTGIVSASLLHALFNFFIIINNGQNIFRVLIALWILTVAIIILFEKIKHIKLSYVQR